MTDSLSIPLLSLLADGREHKAIELETELRKSLPLSITLRTEYVLSLLAEDSLVHEHEHDWDRYTITQDGIRRLAVLRDEASRPVVKAKKQAALFS